MGNKVIYAMYDDKNIRVYQAFNDEIADEALKKGTFSSKFKMERMTWIKTSFLWMMARSNWAGKEGQERILAIDITIEGFREILNHAILSSYKETIYPSYSEWKSLLTNSEVRCQWDPDKDLHGNPMSDRAIQLGLRGGMVERYVNHWITKITDITDYVKDTKRLVDYFETDRIRLPETKEFILSEEEKLKLGI